MAEKEAPPAKASFQTWKGGMGRSTNREPEPRQGRIAGRRAL